MIRSSGRLGDEHDREASWHGPRHQPPQTRQSITTTPLFKSGPRNSHCGAFEVAYQLGLEGRQVWDEPAPDTRHYDLVVVGAGIRGLASARFYIDVHPLAKILILENRIRVEQQANHGSRRQPVSRSTGGLQTAGVFT